MKPYCILLILLLAAPAGAALPELSPLSARYRITVNGIPAGTAATVNVRSLGSEQHEIDFRVENRFLKNHEISRFNWQNCKVVAHEYQHEFHGLGIDRQSAITFDWQRHVAIESRGNQKRELPLSGEIFDGLNMAMLARCRLRDGARSLDFPILYRGERKNLHFEITGQETIETPLGTFDTWIVERRYPQRFKRTRVWVAPALDWFMVRFEHVENPAARGSLLLTDITIDGHRMAPATKQHEQ